MKKVRWGILSTAKIAVEKVIPAMQKGRLTEVVALGSRYNDKAQAVAGQLGIPRCYASYDDLLSDAEVEAIYNPLPNHLHVPWSIKALEAGKHVLCEKPIALAAAEAAQLVRAARKHPRLKVMEAFMYRHHPQWQKARELVRTGAIGELRAIETFFSYFTEDPANIRNISDIGGGALLDIGCYPVSLSRFLFDAEPVRVFGAIYNDPRFHTDRLTTAILDFSTGVSTFTCSTQLVPYQRVNIFGSRGRIEIDIPFNAPSDRPCVVHFERDGKIETLCMPLVDQYTLQGDLFAEAILGDKPTPIPIEDAVRNMDSIEAVFQSARQGRWVPVAATPI